MTLNNNIKELSLLSKGSFLQIIFSNFVVINTLIFAVLHLVNPYIFPKIYFVFVLFINLIVELRSISKDQFRIVYFFLFLIPIAAINVYNKGQGISTIVLLLLQMGLVFTALNSKIYSRLILVYFYTYVAIMIFINLFLGLSLDKVFMTGSRNLVSFVAIVVLIYYYANSFKNGENLSIIPAIVLVLFAIIAQGRSGILVSALALLGILYFRLTSKFFTSLYYIVVLLLVVLFIVDQFQLFFTERLSYLVENKFESDSRVFLFNEYLHNIDIYTFLFGVRNDIYPFDQFNNNFHNAFLLAHSSFGISFIIIPIYAGIVIITRKNFLFNYLLVVLALRALTDIVFFVNSFDFIFYFLLFYRNKET